MMKREDVAYNINDYYDISQEAQVLLRIGNSNIIQELCVELKLSTEVVATALIIAHYYFARKCYLFHDRYLICVSSVFLAAKLTNHQRKIAEYCSKLYKLRHVSITNVDHNKLEDAKNQIYQCELSILETMDYNLNLDMPYDYITYYTELLYPNQKKAIGQAALCISCDIYHTEACILYNARIIAVACIIMAAKLTGIPSMHEPNYDQDCWKNIITNKLSQSRIQEENPFKAMPLDEYMSMPWNKKIHPSIEEKPIEEIIKIVNEFHEIYKTLE